MKTNLLGAMKVKLMQSIASIKNTNFSLPFFINSIFTFLRFISYPHKNILHHLFCPCEYFLLNKN